MNSNYLFGSLATVLRVVSSFFAQISAQICYQLKELEQENTHSERLVPDLSG